MLNKVFLIGNLTKDPDGPRPAGSSTVTNFRIAVNERFGEGKERTLFIDVDCWGRTAELAAEYLHKGRRVFIEGRLQLDEWGEGEERRSKHKVVAFNIQFLDGRGRDGEGGGGDYGERDDYRGSGPASPPRSESTGSEGRSEGGPAKSSLPDYGLDDDVPF